MTDLTGWLVMAGVLVVFELLTGTFYVLMIAIGMAFGALAAVLGWSLPVQVLIAAVVGVISTGVLHRSRFGRPVRQDAARDPNVNIDIGQEVRVETWSNGRARTAYRGAQWDIELAPGAVAEAGNFKIVEVRGNRLVVNNA
jgi:membrane protein implicated in regulation of membrane protease activity